MATDVRESWSDESFESDTSRRAFTVLFDRAPPAGRGATLAILAAGIPRPPSGGRPADAHPADRTRLVSGLSARCLSPILYEVIVTYKGRAVATTSGGGSASVRRPDIRFFGVVTQEPIDTDVKGKLIANTVGERFDPGIQIEYRDWGVRIAQDERALNAARDYRYVGERGCLNSDRFWFAGPGAAKLVDIQVDPTGDAIYPWHKTYEIHFRRGGWRQRLVNRGYRYKETAKSTKAVIAKDSNGEPVAEPVNLNEDGTRRAEGLQPVWLEFDVIPELPFGVLHLPGQPR